MKYYIATKLENHEEHNRLRDILNSHGHKCTYDWTEHGPVYRDGMDRIRDIANKETDGVLLCDWLIVLWPGGRGTHVELGIALGGASIYEYANEKTKRIFIISNVQGHHEASQEICAFYAHPLVVMYKTIEEFVEQEL